MLFCSSSVASLIRFKASEQSSADAFDNVPSAKSSATMATPMERCRGVVGLTGQLALVWPAYWGGRISGNATVTSMVPVEVVVAVLGFLAVLALAQAYTSLKRKEQETAAERKPLESARNEPLIKTSALTDNRRKRFLVRRSSAPCSEG